MKILNTEQLSASCPTILYFGEFILWVNLTKTSEIMCPYRNIAVKRNHTLFIDLGIPKIPSSPWLMFTLKYENLKICE